MSKKQQIALLILTFFTMIVMSICVSYRGLLLPTFKDTFQFDNTAAGVFISVAQLVSVVFTYYGGLYCNKIGQAKLVVYSALLIAVSCVFTAFSQSFLMLTIGFVGISSGVSVLVLALNTILPLLTIAAQTILMNLLHFCFGFGTTLSQKGVSLYLSYGLDWRHLFSGIAVVFILIALAFMRQPIRSNMQVAEVSKEIPHKKFAIFIILGLSLYITSEFLAASWLINYFKEGFKYSEAQSAYYTTLFFLTFTLGRLFGGFILDKIDFLTGIICCTVGATITMFFGAVLGPFAFILIGLSGTFYSVIYPTTITLINYIYADKSAYFIGVLSTVSALLIFGTNLLYGALNDFIGVVPTFYMIWILMLISTLFFILAKVERKNLPNGQWEA